MNEALEYLDGAMRITPLGLLVCVLSFGFYLLSWIRWSRRTGVVLPFVHWYLLIFLVLPSFLLYSFCSSEVNIITVGVDIYSIQETIESALLITFLGACCLVAGYMLPARYVGRGHQIGIQARGLRLALEQAFLSPLLLKVLLGFITIASVSLLALTLPRTGFTFDLRAEFLLNPALRAVFNFWYSLYIYVTTIALLATFGKRQIWLVFVVLSPSIFLAFISGSRTVALLPFMYLIVIYSEVRASLRFRGLVITLASVLFIAIVLYQVRQSDSIEAVDVEGLSPFLFSIFYGNTFSDLRDFALVLSAWDGEYIWGKSYLAGVLGFVPRSLSDFREIYSIGVFTNNFLGFDSSVHPGVRMGMFGEAYLNFSYPGVMVVGLLAGMVYKKVNSRLSAWRRRGDVGTPLMRGYVELLPAILVSNIYVSAAMWSLYIFAFLCAVALLVYAMERVEKPLPKPLDSRAST